MSKLSRQNAIRELLQSGAMPSQDDFRRGLSRQGFKVTQATLSRDIRDLGLVKTARGYELPQKEAAHEATLPSLPRLVREFVREVRRAQNQVLLKTAVGSAQPVAAALDAENWPEVVGTIGGDDTILVISPDSKHAQSLEARIAEMMA